MTDEQQRIRELEDRMVQLEAQLAGQVPERRRRWRAKLVVGAGLVGALTVSSLAVGGVGEVLRQEVRNGTTGSETEIIGKFDASTGRKGGYVTRQSNTQTGAKAGGGAIYGCRGAAGGTAAGSAPCVRANNLANGFAFEFDSSAGPAGLFAVGAATDAPFVTNGTGLVANLNADKVDGLDASQLKGQQGPTGPQGPKGDTGTVDTSNFYDKATSDARFLGATAKAADSDKLDGIDSTALDDIVQSGTTFNGAFAPLAPGACRAAGDYTGAPVGKMVVASTTRAYAQQGITLTGNVVQDQAGSDTNLAVVTFCNVSNADVPGTGDMPIFWAVLNAP